MSAFPVVMPAAPVPVLPVQVAKPAPPPLPAYEPRAPSGD
jgi:hypothetical protein